jgi:hypothetical protein
MARGKTIYLKSESGRVEDFDQFRKRLQKLGTSETLRFRELRNLLKQEARPLVERPARKLITIPRRSLGIRSAAAKPPSEAIRARL